MSFYQLITKVDEVYQITIPNDVKAIMDAFSVGVSFGLGSSDSALTCLGLSHFENKVSP